MLVVLAASAIAVYFLQETVRGFDTNYTTTKTEIRSVHDYPFPAITFHPGHFNSKKAFFQTFLNQFQMTRFNNDPGYETLQNNTKFLQQFGLLIDKLDIDKGGIQMKKNS